MKKDLYFGRDYLSPRNSGLSCAIFVDMMETYKQEHVPKCIEVQIKEGKTPYNIIYMDLKGNLYYKPFQKLFRSSSLKKINLNSVKCFVEQNKELLYYISDHPEEALEKIEKDLKRYEMEK